MNGNRIKDMNRILVILLSVAIALGADAQEQKRTFTVVKENPITSVKNQHRSGTCWDFATLGFFESEILRKSGRVFDLCEMFVVNKDYMDCATHYVRMHGYSRKTQPQISHYCNDHHRGIYLLYCDPGSNQCCKSIQKERRSRHNAQRHINGGCCRSGAFTAALHAWDIWRPR